MHMTMPSANRARSALVALALVGVLAATSQAGNFVLVKIVDRDGTEHHEVMTPDQVRALQAEIQQETKLYPKALNQAREAWEKDQENTKSFPGNAIHRRSATPVGAPFDDETKATEKRDKITERNAAKLADEGDKLAQRMRDRYPGDKRKEKMAELKARDAERKAVEDKARGLYEKELAQLRAGAAPTSGATAAP